MAPVLYAQTNIAGTITKLPPALLRTLPPALILYVPLGSQALLWRATGIIVLTRHCRGTTMAYEYNHAVRRVSHSVPCTRPLSPPYLYQPGLMACTIVIYLVVFFFFFSPLKSASFFFFFL